MVLSGPQRADLARLASDLTRICEEQVRMFGEPVPMPRYLFLTRVVKKGYGGLEHRDSSALMCSRDDLPLPGETRPSRGYRGFLGLCSHEYFHLWNVERIRPQAFLQNDLSREAYTEDLWAYEGVTSYYDELVMVRAGLIDLTSYLELLSDAATRLWRTPGRARQSLAASSFDAWTKFYRPDENTPNAVVSYYNKGALVALCLDLKLRLETDGRLDLDQVMRELWRRHGQTGAGVPERELERLAADMSGLRLDTFFDGLVRGVEDPPIAELLAAFGIEGRLRAAPSGSEREGVNLGVRIVPGSSPPQIAHVLDRTPAQAAGLSAGDALIAIDGLRVEGPDLDRMLLSYAPGDGIDVHVFRRDELMKFRVQLEARPADSWTFRVVSDAEPAAIARRKSWLRQS
jgi:predicted metalloprotease with PDZ domain